MKRKPMTGMVLTAPDGTDLRDSLRRKHKRDRGYAGLLLVRASRPRQAWFNFPARRLAPRSPAYSAAPRARAVATTSAMSVARCSELVSGCRMQARSVSRPPKTLPVTKACPRA